MDRSLTKINASADRWAASFLSWRGALPLFLVVAISGGLLRFWGPCFFMRAFYAPAWDYFLPGLTLNYGEMGFTRRALVGTLTNAFGVEPTVLAVKLIYIGGVVAATTALFALAWTATRSLLPRERVLVLVLLGLSPATLLHWVENAGRLDVWVVCLGVLAALLSSSRGAHLLAVVPASLAGLIHEAYFLLFGPLFLAIGYERYRRALLTRSEVLRGVAAMGVLAVAFGYLLFFGSADFADLARAAERIGVTISRSGTNPFYSYLGFEANPVGWTMCFFREDPTLILSTLVALIYLVVHGTALLGWSGRIRMSLTFVPILGVVALAFIALDSSRYAAMAAIAIWLHFFFVLQTEKSRSVFSPWPLGALCVFTALGPLGISHGFHSVLWMLSFVGGRQFRELAPTCDAALEL